jgi:hypothetical protein
MDNLNNSRNGGVQLDIPSLVESLADSVASIGAANVNLVRRRNEMIKKDLSVILQGLCSN